MQNNPFIMKFFSYLNNISLLKNNSKFQLTYTKNFLEDKMKNNLELFPENPIISPKKYKKVIVVGSGSSRLNKNNGKWIDSHDCIIRFNFAPTKGYEHYIGSKTTLRIVEKDRAFKEFDDEIILHRYKDIKYFFSAIEKKQFENFNLHVLNKIFNNNAVGISSISSGLAGIILGFILASDELNIIGFDGYSPHYFENDKNPEISRHKFQFYQHYNVEQFFIRKMKELKIIKEIR